MMDAFEKTLTLMSKDKDFNDDERHMIEAILTMYKIHQLLSKAETIIEKINKKEDDDDE